MSVSEKTAKKAVEEPSMEMNDDVSFKAYELMVIISNTLRDTEAKKEVEMIEKWIEKNKGKVTVNDFWGKKRLAYPIQHQEEGYYSVFNFELSPDRAQAMEKMLRLEKQIARYLILTLPKDYKYVSFKELEEKKEEIRRPENMEEKLSKVVIEKKSKEEAEPMKSKEKEAPKIAETAAPEKSKEEPVDKDLDAKLDKILGGDLNF